VCFTWRPCMRIARAIGIIMNPLILKLGMFLLLP
jgi:hypothetical protein